MRVTLTALATLALAGAAVAEPVAPMDVVYEDGAIAGSLTGLAGDPDNGARLMNKGAGNCIACHQVTALEALPFHGEIGPSLDGVSERWSEAEIRGIVANAKEMFPDSMMPSFYRVSGFVRPGKAYTGKAIDPAELTPLLTAQEIEDLVSYLITLKYE